MEHVLGDFWVYMAVGQITKLPPYRDVQFTYHAVLLMYTLSPLGAPHEQMALASVGCSSNESFLSRAGAPEGTVRQQDELHNPPFLASLAPWIHDGEGVGYEAEATST